MSSACSLYSLLHWRQNEPRKKQLSHLRFASECRARLVPRISLSHRFPCAENDPSLGTIKWLRCNPDGRRVCLYRGDDVQIWQPNVRAAKGGEGHRAHHLRTLAGHTAMVTSAVWTAADVDDLFTCSHDQTIRRWKGDRCVEVRSKHNDWLSCMSISHDDMKLVSGCVSSRIVGWDNPTGQLLFQLENGVRGGELNPITSLSFTKRNSNLLVSGSSNGVVKMWDVRQRVPALFSIKAHVGTPNRKVNSVVFDGTDVCLLSAGRDSAIRLWDTRSAGRGKHFTLDGGDPMVRQYTQGHTCTNYNMQAEFYNGGQNIVTGSEDGTICVYSVASGDVACRLDGHGGHVVHAVHAPTSASDLMIVSASILSTEGRVWLPVDTSARPHLLSRKRGSSDDDACSALASKRKFVQTSHRPSWERIAGKYGEHILEIFHRHKFNQQYQGDWHRLVEEVGKDNQSADLLEMLSEMASDFQFSLRLSPSVLGMAGAVDGDSATATTASPSTPLPLPLPLGRSSIPSAHIPAVSVGQTEPAHAHTRPKGSLQQMIETRQIARERRLLERQRQRHQVSVAASSAKAALDLGLMDERLRRLTDADAPRSMWFTDLPHDHVDRDPSELKDSILAFFENDEQQAWSGSTSASEASTIQTGCATPEMQCE